jgi:hypothetical protein|tara:strand:+ start:518 stop:1348 length:831 start_codon:yes stop_codon:yes gene_type:complete
MKQITLNKNSSFEPKDFVYKNVKETDFDIIINENTTIRDQNTGEIILVYMKLKEGVDELREAIINLKYVKGRRAQGLKAFDKIFGYMSRIGFQNDYCSTAGFARESPKNHKIVCDYGDKLGDLYKEMVPEMYNKHSKIVAEKVKPEWVLGNSPFTSGVINKNNQLNYHFDSGNFKDVFSNMIAFRKKIEGGRLSLPEYNIGLEIDDSTVTLFDGQKILHGVTPINYLTPESYRFSIVYYSLSQMWKCTSPKEELDRIKKVKTERNQKRFKQMSEID